jgi:hypothetical protein
MVPAGRTRSAAPTETGLSPRRFGPRLLTALIGPLALAVILVLRHFGLIASEPVWLWVVVLIALPPVSVLSEALDTKGSSPLRLNARVAWHAAVVTTVIYLTGWGPVLVCAFTFAALETVSHDGSRTWRVSMARSQRRS